MKIDNLLRQLSAAEEHIDEMPAHLATYHMRHFSRYAIQLEAISDGFVTPFKDLSEDKKIVATSMAARMNVHLKVLNNSPYFLAAQAISLTAAQAVAYSRQYGDHLETINKKNPDIQQNIMAMIKARLNMTDPDEQTDRSDKPDCKAA